jgi:DNA-binding MarR family transcriptional regulator
VIRIIKCCFRPTPLRSAYTGPREEKTAISSQTPTESDYEGAAALRLALRTFLQRSEQVARRHKLTPQRYQLLLLIKVADGQATIGSLGRSLRLGQSNVTQQVRRAENLELVRRELSSTDARVRYLRLTAEGERRLTGAVAELREDRETLRVALAEIEPAR